MAVSHRRVRTVRDGQGIRVTPVRDHRTPHPASVTRVAGACALLSLLLGSGCSTIEEGPRVIFCDGAGWSGSHRPVSAGLRAAGFRGRVESFAWSTLLGPGADHYLVARKKSKGEELAARIVEIRKAHPDASLHLMGLSAGTAVVVFALEQLPDGVRVDNVVLFSASLSERHDLATAMQHVRGRLYATCSMRDRILSGVGVTADGLSGRPAGLGGLRIPDRMRSDDGYARVVNLHWRPAYAGFGWTGTHTGVADKRFVQHVIAPRLLDPLPHPLDRPLASSRTGRYGTLARTP